MVRFITILALFFSGHQGFANENVEPVGGRINTGTFEVPNPQTGKMDRVSSETLYFVIEGDKMISNADLAVRAAKDFLHEEIKKNPNIKKFTFVLNKGKGKVDKYFTDEIAAKQIARYIGAEKAEVVLNMLPDSVIVNTEISEESMKHFRIGKEGQKNSVKLYVMAATRTFVNGMGVYAGLTLIPAEGLAPEISIPMAVLSGMMSGFLMLKNVWVIKWFSGKGYLNPSELKPSSFPETLAKDGLLTLVYVGAVHFLRGIIEGDPFAHMVQSGFPLLNDGIIKAVMIGAISEGFWNANLSHGTKLLVERFPHKAGLIWQLSGVPFFTLSALATFGTVVGAAGFPWGDYMLIGLTASAVVVDVYFVGNLKKLYEQTKAYARTFNRSYKCEAVFQ